MIRQWLREVLPRVIAAAAPFTTALVVATCLPLLLAVPAGAEQAAVRDSAGGPLVVAGSPRSGCTR